MKYKQQIWRVGAMVLLCVFGILCRMPSDAAAAEAGRVLVTQDGTVQEYDAEPVQIQYADDLFSCKLPPVKIGDIWMAPVEEVFSEILGFSCQFSEDGAEVLLKTPGRESVVGFTLDSSTMTVDGVSYQMPFAMLAASAAQEDGGREDCLVPLEFVLHTLDYTYDIQDVLTPENTVRHVIQIQSSYLFYKHADDVAYDTEKYDNAWIGISIMKNGTGKKNIIRAVTQNPIPAEQITVTQDVRESSVTLAFQKTYNPFGSFTEVMNTVAILKIEVWEEDGTSFLKICYQPNYIFTRKILENGGMITLSKASFSLRVLLPDDVDFSKITTKDQYWDQKFLILIPGGHTAFYKEYPPVSNASAIEQVKVTKTAEGNTKIAVTTSALKGYKLTEEDGYFTVKIGAPQKIYDNIVLLDAGHGGKDAGASRTGLKEKKLTLTILYRYAREFFESMTSKVKAYWTRHDDTFINLYTRPTLTKKYHADLFVSLHMNSASSSSANGSEVYYSKSNNRENDSGLTSKKFARLMENTLVDNLGCKDRGVRQAGFVVIKNNTVPAVLIELGFITGKTDATKLKKTSYQKKAAKTIYEGIEKTFEKYPPD